jgi:hypothetical protein
MGLTLSARKSRVFRRRTNVLHLSTTGLSVLPFGGKRQEDTINEAKVTGNKQ